LQKWQVVAGLVSYLYKYPEIKERIEILRKQQLKADKPTTAQKASDNLKLLLSTNFESESSNLKLR